jgi:MFS family permease
MGVFSLPLPLLCLLPLIAAYFLDYADGAYFNGVFRALEVDLQLSVYQLVIMQGVAGFSVMFCGPMWAVLIDHRLFTRKTLLVAGSAGWGATSILIAISAHDFGKLLLLRFVCTAFLCSGAPIVQSVVGCSVAPELRGQCFSFLAMAGSIAVIMTSQLSTAISEQEIFHLNGWRFGLLCIGAASTFCSLVTYAIMQEPPRDFYYDGPEAVDAWSALANIAKLDPLLALRNLRDHWHSYSFRLLCILGSCSTFSWQVMVFATLYFQYSGFSDWQAGLATASWHFGDLCANLCGGIVSDQLHRHYGIRGRLYLAQVNVGCALPVLVALFAFPGQLSVVPASVLMFLFGFLVGACDGAVNKPVLSHIAPTSHMASIMAWEQTLENAIGAIWGPAALLSLQSLAGYREAAIPASEMSLELRQNNANGLAFVILLFTGTACVCVVCGYTALHWTIPRDMAQTSVKLNNAEEAPLVKDTSP